jgi:CO/xanthine dehydrogenase FAD-binding subunit
VRRFSFHRATTLDEALALKAAHGQSARFVAGGTDLLVEVRRQSADAPELAIIDITRIEALRGITLETDGPASGMARDPAEAQAGTATHETLRIGPLTTHDELEYGALIQKRVPFLAAAAASIGSPQIRCRGTLGGNLCTAAACADTAPPLLALGAVLTLRSARGARELPLSEFLVAPHTTAIAADELLTDVRCPLPAPGSAMAFAKLGRRGALSISRLSIAVVLRRDRRGALGDVRLAAGSVAPAPRRFPAVESFLQGRVPEPGLFADAGRLLSQEMIRLTGRRWSTPYKEPVVAALLERTLAEAVGGDQRD